MSHSIRTKLRRSIWTITGIVTLLLAISLVLSGCSHQHPKNLQRKLLHRSLETYPAWITRLPTNNDYFYALGISTDAPSLRQGRLLAAKNAVIEVSNYLGLKARGHFEVKKTELTTRIYNAISVTTSASLKRSRLSQMYYEEFTYAGAEEKANVFDVYILLRIPMADLKQEQLRQKQKKNKILLEAESLNLEAQNNLQTGNFPLAWQKWMLAMRLIDEEADDSVSSLQIYKSLLTAVEGINLTIVRENNHHSNTHSNASPRLITQAFFTAKTGDIPLKKLPLHFRFSNNRQAGEIKNTNPLGVIETSLSSPASKGLQVRLIMSPYAVDRAGLSSQTMQKIQFLKSMLEHKLAQYGSMPFSSPLTGQQIARSPVQQAVSSKQSGRAYTETGSLINIVVATNTPYILLDDKQRYKMAIKVDISTSQAESLKRPPLNIAVVIDKSNSMNANGKIDYTKKASEFLIDHLTEQDYLSIVAYSTDVQVVVPAERVSSKALLKHHLSEIDANGMTNLSGGIFEGYTQVKKHLNENNINSILLLSDGKANRGITRSKDLIPYLQQYNKEGIGVSALGVGVNFNEELMMKIAESSNGNYYFIKNPEDIPAIFSQELTRLINVAAQNILVSIELKDGIKLADSFGHTFTLPAKNKYEFRLGDLNYDDRGILLLELSLPVDMQGLKDVAVVEVSYEDIENKKRLTYKNRLTVTYTQNEKLYQESINHEVDKYVALTRSREELERVLESLDHGLYEQAIINIRKTYASIESFARETEDAEFLQHLELLKHFEREVLELKESGDLHEHIDELQKNLSYRLYLEKHSHRAIDHPLHFSD